MTWTIVEGDTAPLLTATLSTETGAQSLSGATVECTARIGAVSVTKSATVTDAANGVVTVDFEGALPAGVGNARFKVTFGSGKVRYFPSETAVQIRVVAR